LVNRFIDRWKSKEKEPSLTSKVRNVGKPSQDLKQQINLVIQRLDVQTQTLDKAVRRFDDRDAGVFKCVVKALSERDKARANILATELWEIRKVKKMLMQSSLAMESVSMRLNTASELGDLVAILAPAASVLGNIRSGMSSVLPEAGRELENIGNLLSDIVISTNQSTEMPVDIGTANSEAKGILEEAELAVEKKLREQLPEVASEFGVRKQTSIEA
jgi:division protein CdvB (Snf7/Vps24/ESCRT-III family)